MSGIIKLILVGAILLGGYGVWKFATAPEGEKTEENTLYSVQSGDHVKGNADAPVTLIEYTDFQCPACGAYYPVLKQLLSDPELDGKFKLVIRHYPLIQIHPNALAAARATEAASRQGKFFEMYDVLFSKQAEWSKAADPVKSIFPSYAGSIGLDVEQFRKDVADGSIDDKINEDRKSGDELGVEGTPSFYMNGEKLVNPNSIEEFKTLIKAAAIKAPKVEQKENEEVHEHIDFKVYLDNKAIDFSQDKYQSTLEGKELDEWSHLHDKVGGIVHKHKKGITLGYFFKTLGMDFTKECFQLDGGQKYCNGNGKTLKFYINGTPSDLFGEYELHDLDRVLISYGAENETVLKTQLDSVGNDACIYSEKCPERGKAPTEECVGGLGSNCE